MKKNSLIILLFVCLGMSCTQNNVPVNDVKHLTSVVLASDKFKILGVNVSQLNLNGSIIDTTPAGKKLLIIPAKTDGKNNAVLAVIDDRQNVSFSIYMQIKQDAVATSDAIFKQVVPTGDGPAPAPTNPTPDDPGYDAVSAAYHAGKLNASMTITASTSYQVIYPFHFSKVTGATVVPFGSAANTDRCKGWTSTGGPLDCAGQALVNTGPISSAACYWTFGYCFGALIIDCWLTGC